MRRSRRSLFLLLAVMGWSLFVVRVTSGPACPPPARPLILTAVGHDPFGRGAAYGGWRQSLSDAPAPTYLSVAQAPLQPAECLAAEPSGCDEMHAGPAQLATPAIVMARAPSMVSVIFVLPKTATTDVSPPAPGWSGCTAFASGCDHLGRAASHVAGARRSFHHRLIMHALEQLARLTMRASNETAAVVCRANADYDPRQSLASERRLLKRSPGARQPVGLDEFGF
jgi:hypothetical protein